MLNESRCFRVIINVFAHMLYFARSAISQVALFYSQNFTGSSLLYDLFLERKNCFFAVCFVFEKKKTLSLLYDLSLEKKSCFFAV